MKYKCVKYFEIPIVDDNHEQTEKHRIIEKGSLWEKEEAGYLYVVDEKEGGLRLVNDEAEWIEIYQDHLEEHFEALESESHD